MNLRGSTNSLCGERERERERKREVMYSLSNKRLIFLVSQGIKFEGLY